MKYLKLKKWITIILILITSIGCAGRAFKVAQEKNTIEDYNQFLLDYGDSEFVSQVKKLKEKVWFEYSRKKNTIQAYSGGRKRLIEKEPELSESLEKLAEPITRGDPESPLRRTCKSTRKLADLNLMRDDFHGEWNYSIHPRKIN